MSADAALWDITTDEHGAPTGIELGQALRDEGVARADANAPQDWKDRCDRAIEVMAATGREFQTYHLILAGLVDEPPDHHQWAGRFEAAKRRKVIEWVRADRSIRPTARRSFTGVWRGRQPQEGTA